MKKLMAKIKTLLENHRQLQELAMYLIFGVLTTAVNWAAYLLLTWALGLRQTLPGSTP